MSWRRLLRSILALILCIVIPLTMTGCKMKVGEILGKVLNGIKGIVSGAKGFLGVLGPVLGFFGVPAGFVTSALGVLDKVDGFTNQLGQAKGFVDKVENTVNTVKNLPNTLSNAYNSIKNGFDGGFVNGVKNLANVGKGLKNTYNGLTNTVKDVKSLGQQAQGLFGGGKTDTNVGPSAQQPSGASLESGGTITIPPSKEANADGSFSSTKVKSAEEINAEYENQGGNGGAVTYPVDMGQPIESKPLEPLDNSGGAVTYPVDMGQPIESKPLEPLDNGTTTNPDYLPGDSTPEGYEANHSGPSGNYDLTEEAPPDTIDYNNSAGNDYSTPETYEAREAK